MTRLVSSTLLPRRAPPDAVTVPGADAAVHRGGRVAVGRSAADAVTPASDIPGARARGGERSARIVADLLARADVVIGGERDWDIRIYDERVFDALLGRGSLGLGEAYMDGWWDCPRLDELFLRVLRAGLATPRRSLPDWLVLIRARLFNRQSPARAGQVAERHYDLSNELYRRMLDPLMMYSCAYWQGGRDGARATTLAQAQVDKLDLICRKLGLRPGMRVLDIGCGWGGMARYAAERHGVEVVGVTVSARQAEEARATCRGLPVEIVLSDYRALTGSFDRILSIGMFEHVGPKNYPVYMRTARRLLKPDGLFLLHTIGCRRSGGGIDAWIERHIFPNAVLPTAAQLAAAAGDDGGFVIEDWHSFGQDYDPTLMAWHANLIPHRPWIAAGFGERFLRMWDYYLLTCAASFRARKNQLWQVVLSPQGVMGGYTSVR